MCQLGSQGLFILALHSLQLICGQVQKSDRNQCNSRCSPWTEKQFCKAKLFCPDFIRVNLRIRARVISQGFISFYIDLRWVIWSALVWLLRLVFFFGPTCHSNNRLEFVWIPSTDFLNSFKTSWPASEVCLSFLFPMKETPAPSVP